MIVILKSFCSRLTSLTPDLETNRINSMISKLITMAQTREEAIRTMERALSEYVIEGVKTTIPFHVQLMQHPDFRKGNYTTKFLENFKLV